LVLLAGWVAFLAPWVLTRRDPYIYHYLPAYAFGVLLLAGYLEFALQRRPKWTEGLLVAILVVSLVYLPVWIGLGLDKTGLEARLFPLSWR
jgi:dolichyl-phosphate-mannose--protein O-mannosyl transferase